MKKLNLFIALIALLSCKAQSPIISIGDYSQDIVAGCYLKDVNNQLDPFVGTWSYQNGNTSFTISFRKIVQYYNGTWYEDKLIGDYQYIEEGQELVNYLPNFNDPNINDAQHTIKGSMMIYTKQFPKCEECEDSDIRERVRLTFYDTERKYLSNELVIWYYIENYNIEKIKVWLYDAGTAVLPYEGAPQEIRVPYGEYVLTKVQ